MAFSHPISVDPISLASPFNFPPVCRFCHTDLGINKPVHFANSFSIDAVLAQPVRPNRIVMCPCGKDGRCVPMKKSKALNGRRTTTVVKRRSLAQLLGLTSMSSGSLFGALAASLSGSKTVGVKA